MTAALIFEPHSGFGGSDPDGEPWPFGYLSEGVGEPVFELNVVTAQPPEKLARIALAAAAAPDLLEALQEVLVALEASRGNGEFPDFDAWETKANAAIAKAAPQSPTPNSSGPTLASTGDAG